jgi:xanthosine utilization system XapX-like protein
VILAGLTYTLLHLWDAWTVFSSPRGAVLSVIFLLFTYFGPGMIKAVLTMRTGNAWVHVWAYHALAPHTLGDTSHTVEVFHIR